MMRFIWQASYRVGTLASSSANRQCIDRGRNDACRNQVLLCCLPLCTLQGIWGKSSFSELCLQSSRTSSLSMRQSLTYKVFFELSNCELLAGRFLKMQSLEHIQCSSTLGNRSTQRVVMRTLGGKGLLYLSLGLCIVSQGECNGRYYHR